MLELKTPRGLRVQVPEVESEDPSPKFDLQDRDGFLRYYNDNGYVIIRGLLAAQQCDEVRRLWDTEVKPFEGFIYRQATAKVERHTKNARGWIMNPILSLQSVSPRHFPKFRRFATDEILTHPRLTQFFGAVFNDTPKIVQSMYMEGNAATWEHQDSYYLDSETVGEMSAAWIALEDIAATAGRFFICPRSHLIQLDEHSLDNSFVENHEAYISSVVDHIQQQGLPIRAPILNRGDVLFWNALTIHGSLDSHDPVHSRSSITCHAIPNQKRFLQLQMRVLDLKTDMVNGVHVYRPKDLARIRNRLIFFVESNFPAAFYWLKRRAILFFLQRKEAGARRPLGSAGSP